MIRKLFFLSLCAMQMTSLTAEEVADTSRVVDLDGKSGHGQCSESCCHENGSLHVLCFQITLQRYYNCAVAAILIYMDLGEENALIF